MRENPDVCKSMCTFLPRFKYLFLMCDIVIAGGEWTFHFSVCLKEVTHASIYSPRFVLCYLLV